MNEVRQVSKLQKETLDKGHFFENLIEVLVEKNLLGAEELQSIQIQLLNLLSEQIEAFNKGKSSSMPKKQAENLMQSIYFTLGFYFKGLEQLDESITLLKEKTVKEIFKEGQEKIKTAVKKVQQDLEQLRQEVLPTLNIAYQDTYQKGLQLFFKFYDPEFFSHENPGDVDYPLSVDDMSELGIDYMRSYVEKSVLENKFCRKFNSGEIEVLLGNYEKGYQHLLINIYEIVLMNVLGHQLLSQENAHLLLKEEDIIELQQKFQNLPDIDELLYQKSEEILDELGLNTSEMKGYIHLTINKLLPHIKLLVKEKRLKEIFIIKKENEEMITYKGGEKLSDECFKALTEEIRSCEHVEDKIKLIREAVTNAEDLKDILEAECFFEEEYRRFYEILSEVETALLLREELADEFGEISAEDMDEKEWKIILKAYLNEQNAEKMNKILNIAKHIIEA